LFFLPSFYHCLSHHTKIVQKSVLSSYLECPVFDEKSDRSKDREVTTIRAELKRDPVRMIMVCHYAANKSINVDLYAVLDKILKSLEIPTKIKKLLNELFQ